MTEPVPGDPPTVPFLSLGVRSPALARGRGRGVRVAVVDSGIHRGNPHVRPGRVLEGTAVDPHGGTGTDVTDRLGHGTAVTAAIQEKAPEAEILPVRVFEAELATSVPGLVAGLERAVEAGVHLINLSLGTPRTGRLQELEAAFDRARSAGVLLVSPREHRGRRWWPGSFPGALGVLLDAGCPRDELRLVAGPEGEPVLRASGLPRPIPGVPPHRNLRGISFAAANVTGILARVLEARPGARDADGMARALRELAAAGPGEDGA